MFLVVFSAFGQENVALRHCKTKEYRMDFYILLKKKNVHYLDTTTYSWFKAQQIYETQGRSSGNLLHGKYTKYYHSGQLAQQGTYKYGLKNGIWVTWYPSGKIKSKYRFRKGQVKGIFQEYHESGVILKEGVYKKGIPILKKEMDKQSKPSPKGRVEKWKQFFKKTDKESKPKKEKEKKQKKSAEDKQ